MERSIFRGFLYLLHSSIVQKRCIIIGNLENLQFSKKEEKEHEGEGEEENGEGVYRIRCEERLGDKRTGRKMGERLYDNEKYTWMPNNLPRVFVFESIDPAK